MQLPTYKYLYIFQKLKKRIIMQLTKENLFTSLFYRLDAPNLKTTKKVKMQKNSKSLREKYLTNIHVHVDVFNLKSNIYTFLQKKKKNKVIVFQLYMEKKRDSRIRTQLKVLFISQVACCRIFNRIPTCTNRYLCNCKLCKKVFMIHGLKKAD